MTKSNPSFRAMIRSPILWGALVCVGFYKLVSAGVIVGPYVDRYFTGHPVEYAATAMFFVGLASLAIKLIEINAQSQRLGTPLLEPTPEAGQPVADCGRLAEQLDRSKSASAGDYLARRLRDAVEYVRRSGSADGLDEELRYLADVDAARLHAGYGLLRVIIWAIPVLGFLGTVIGITLAIGKLSPESLESSLPEVMSSLSIAFYTTTQALGLSIVLMFAQFLTDRQENALLADVDERAEAEMVGRFQRTSREADAQLQTVRQMLETLIAGTEQLVCRQSELWQATLDAAAERWTTMAETAGKQIETALATSLDRSLDKHADSLADTETRFAETNRRNWAPIQQSLTQNAQTLAELNEAMREETEWIGRAVAAAGQVTSLEKTLNDNLHALAGSKNFEQTVMSLAAAIHLLNSRLGVSAADVPSVQLEPSQKTDQAA